MAALTQARMTLTAKNGPSVTKWTLKSMMHEVKDASSKRATQDRAWKLAEGIDNDDQRQTRLCEILTTEANNLTYFQAAWMKRQLTGKATGNMHGVFDKAALATRGLTPQQATALATVVEKALETMMANQEGWAILGMSGDELTTYIVKQQQQHAYGTSENGLIGCDGGLKFGRNYEL
jgi:hypothetical protein